MRLTGMTLRRRRCSQLELMLAAAAAPMTEHEANSRDRYEQLFATVRAQHTYSSRKKTTMFGSFTTALAAMSTKTTVALAAAGTVAVSGTAAVTGVLPDPVQQIAHDAFGAPSPSPTGSPLPGSDDTTDVSTDDNLDDLDDLDEKVTTPAAVLAAQCDDALDYFADVADAKAEGETFDKPEPASLSIVRAAAGSADVTSFCITAISTYKASEPDADKTAEQIAAELAAELEEEARERAEEAEEQARERAEEAEEEARERAEEAEEQAREDAEEAEEQAREDAEDAEEAEEQAREDAEEAQKQAREDARGFDDSDED